MSEAVSVTSTSASVSPDLPQLSEESLQKEVFCVCKDGRVPVRVSLLLQSGAFHDMWKELELANTDDFEFDVKVVTESIFKKVVTWMENHVGMPLPVIEEDPNTHERKWFTFTDFEKEFFKVDVEVLADLLTAGNYLNLKALYLYGCQSMAQLLKERSPEEIRNLLGIEDDLTEEEKAAIRRKNVWCNY